MLPPHFEHLVPFTLAPQLAHFSMSLPSFLPTVIVRLPWCRMRSPRQIPDHPTGYALSLQLRRPATVPELVALAGIASCGLDLGHLAALAFTLAAFSFGLLHNAPFKGF